MSLAAKRANLAAICGGAPVIMPSMFSGLFDGSSYLTFTPSVDSATRQKYTIATWARRNRITHSQWEGLWGVAGGGTMSGVGIEGSTGYVPDSVFQDEDTVGGGEMSYCATSLRLRDPTGWYHVVVAVDTTQAVLADRVKIYVNGVQRSYGHYNSGNMPLNFVMRAGSAGIVHTVGAFEFLTGNMGAFGGYLADFHWIDEQQLPASSFGQFNAYGVWVPKAYAGNYGVNGCRLDFAISGNPGNDVSGLGNHWAQVGTVTRSKDSPQANYATLLSLHPGASLSGGNLVSGAAVPPTLQPDTGGPFSYSDGTEQSASLPFTAALAAGTYDFGQGAFLPSGNNRQIAAINLDHPGVASPRAGSFTGNASADGPVVYLGHPPNKAGVSTINGNAITWGVHADALAIGFKLKTSSASYNAAGTNNFSVAIDPNISTARLAPAQLN